VLFQHGTTRKRAESIRDNGPDPNFCEPGSEEAADGFSTAPIDGPWDLGNPEECARSKAEQFPEEGGPAIVEFELPDDLAGEIVGAIGELAEGKAFHAGSEIRFEPGGGLEQLLDAWPGLTKRVTYLQDPP
jgi:hypothetical protein